MCVCVCVCKQVSEVLISHKTQQTNFYSSDSSNLKSFFKGDHMIIDLPNNFSTPLEVSFKTRSHSLSLSLSLYIYIYIYIYGLCHCQFLPVA